MGRALGVQEEDTLILCPSILSREPCNDILLENISSASSPSLLLETYMDGCIHGWIIVCMAHGWVDAQMDGWMDRQVHGPE